MPPDEMFTHVETELAELAEALEQWADYDAAYRVRILAYELKRIRGEHD